MIKDFRLVDEVRDGTEGVETFYGGPGERGGFDSVLEISGGVVDGEAVAGDVGGCVERGDVATWFRDDDSQLDCQVFVSATELSKRR